MSLVSRTVLGAGYKDDRNSTVIESVKQWSEELMLQDQVADLYQDLELPSAKTILFL